MSDLRAYVRSLIDERFDGNLTHAAKAMGISHSYLSQYLNERTGAGRKLLRCLADLTGKDLGELDRMARPTEPPPDAPGSGSPFDCEHPNEAPHVCPCRVGCYCKTRTCKPAATSAVWFGDIRHRLRAHRAGMVKRVAECEAGMASASRDGSFGEAAALQHRGRAYQLVLADFDLRFPEAKP